MMFETIAPARIELGGSMDARQAYDAVSAVVDPVYVVGGSVRDALMGHECHDFDFATPLEPDRIEQLVRAAGRRPYLVGKKFGTVGFSVGGQIVEVTTFRTESYTAGSRRPRVEFLADLADDLGRRDFTINAMAMHGDEVVDPFGGRDDIGRRVVRAVGDPRGRIGEDPLRMLRAARFAAQLDFTVDADTLDAIRESADRILLVARERWMLELDRLLVGLSATYGLRLLADTSLLAYLLPELSLQVNLADPARPGSTMFERTCTAVDAAPPDVTLRWAALMRDVGEAFAGPGDAGATCSARLTRPDLLGVEIVDKTALYLKWSKRRREDVKRLVAEGYPASMAVGHPAETDDSGETAAE